MDNYDLYMKRLRSHNHITEDSLDRQKVKTMKIALERSYNRETVTLNGRNIACLIGASSSSKVPFEKKTFSTLLESNCDVGSILYWNRLSSHWLITDKRETEKSIFRGFISLAPYEIKWKDVNSNATYSTWGSSTGPGGNTLGEDTEGNISIDMLNRTMTLFISKDIDGYNLLNRYSEVMIQDKKWRIETIDTYSEEKIIGLYLKEVLIDKSRDDEFPNEKVDFAFELKTEMDTMDEVELNSTIPFNPVLYRNGAKVDESFEVRTKNALYKDNQLTFPRIGESIINVYYSDIDAMFTITAEVKETLSATNELIEIQGNSSVRSLTTSSFSLVRIVDGINSELGFTGVWSLDGAFGTIETQNENSVTIKFANKIGTVKLIYKIDGIETYSKEIKVIPIFGRS